MVPLLLVWRGTPPEIDRDAGGVLWLGCTAVIVLSGVHGLRMTYSRSRWKTALLMVLLVFQGGFAFFLGGPPTFLKGRIDNTFATVLAVGLGFSWAGRFALMAYASELVATRWAEG